MYHRGVEMPKIVKSLSDKEISNAKPLEGEYSLSDGDGLHLLIKPDGTKQWVFRYTSPTQNKRRKTSFGTYPKISLVHARKNVMTSKTSSYKGLTP